MRSPPALLAGCFHTWRERPPMGFEPAAVDAPEGHCEPGGL